MVRYLNQLATVFIFIFFASTFLYAQTTVPQGINYQAIVRDNAGVPLPSGDKVDVEFTVNFGLSSIFQEIHSGVTIGEYGLVNLVIGNGTAISKTFAEIDWANTSIPITVEVKVDGISMGSAQPLQAVPYALHCATADALTTSSPLGLWTDAGSAIYYDGGNIGVGHNNPKTKLDLGENIHNPIGGSPDYTVMISSDGDDAFFETHTTDMTGGLLMTNNNRTAGIIHHYAGDYLNGRPEGLHLFTKYVSGPIIFSTNDTERMRVEANGNILLTGKVRTTNTGTANMLCFAHGSIKEGGSIYTGSNNFSVTKIATGEYEVAFDGLNFNLEKFVVSVTPLAISGVPVITSYIQKNNNLVILLQEVSGDFIDTSFSFTVFQP